MAEVTEEVERKLKRVISPENVKIDRGSKRVRFAGGTEGKQTRGPLLPSKPSPAVARRAWLRLCSSGEYKELKKKITDWHEKGLTISNIFSGEGETILGWALSSFARCEPLQFICECLKEGLISERSVSEILEKNNFRIVNGFLKTETGMEKLNFVTVESLKNRRDKISLLLTIHGVRGFMEESLFKNEIARNVKNDIETILKKFNSEESLKTS